jgi:hypothetical protein
VCEASVALVWAWRRLQGPGATRSRRVAARETFFGLFSPPFLTFAPSAGKPNGIRTARKLKLYRQKNRWADKQYNKSHLLSTQKAKPMGAASHAKGIVVERMGIEAKQPNSAIRKCVRVQLIKVRMRCVCLGVLTFAWAERKEDCCLRARRRMLELY